MMTYTELLKEKTRIRLTNPDRYLILTMILDGASKAAKASHVDIVTKADLIATTRSLIAANEKAIEAVRSKNGDTIPYERELEQYREFLGPQKTEAEIRALVQDAVNLLPETERFKKNMKAILASMPILWMSAGIEDQIDPKLVSRALSQLLI